MKKLLALVLALAMVFALAACSKTETTTTTEPAATETPAAAESAPAAEPAQEAAASTAMSYAEFAAAELDSEVTVEAYIQAKQAYSAEYGNTSLYLQDENGGYFVYRIGCTQEEYDAMAIGQKISVTGFKSEWAGEVEIADVSAFAMGEGSYIAPAADVTDALGTDGLADHINQFVAMKGLVVEPIGDGAAFLYNWDGSGEEGSDLYFNVSKDGETYTFTVESYLCDNTTDVYKTVEGLSIGDVIDMTGFLYWYNGPNPHIISVTVK